MTASLHIGDVAQLLGITQKAIRHYHKIGLVAEPSRSEGGYRLYTARELLRIQRIRRLQALGLSLKQIKVLLGEPAIEHERTLRDVLQTLYQQLTDDIQRLEEQRERIAHVLEQETSLDTLIQPEPSRTFSLLKERLKEQLGDIDEKYFQQDEQIFAQLDSFQWPEEYDERWQSVGHYFVRHPEMYALLINFGKRLVDLTDVPPDSPLVDQLIADATSSEVLQVLAQMTELAAQTPQFINPFGDVMGEIMLNTLSPAQQRVLLAISDRK